MADELVRLKVDVIVTGSSRIFGVYSRQGTIQPGADADMVIVDMNREAVISNETTYTKVGWTPYHGRKVKGVPIREWVPTGKTMVIIAMIIAIIAIIEDFFSK